MCRCEGTPGDEPRTYSLHSNGGLAISLNVSNHILAASLANWRLPREQQTVATRMQGGNDADPRGVRACKGPSFAADGIRMALLKDAVPLWMEDFAAHLGVTTDDLEQQLQNCDSDGRFRLQQALVQWAGVWRVSAKAAGLSDFHEFTTEERSRGG